MKRKAKKIKGIIKGENRIRTVNNIKFFIKK